MKISKRLRRERARKGWKIRRARERTWLRFRKAGRFNKVRWTRKDAQRLNEIAKRKHRGLKELFEKFLIEREKKNPFREYQNYVSIVDEIRTFQSQGHNPFIEIILEKGGRKPFDLLQTDYAEDWNPLKLLAEINSWYADHSSPGTGHYARFDSFLRKRIKTSRDRKKVTLVQVRFSRKQKIGHGSITMAAA